MFPGENILLEISLAFSIVGSIVIIYDGILATVNTIIGEVKKHDYYVKTRIDFTRKIALGLEFFIAGDLIRTILEPTIDEIIILIIVVSIRTIIGYTLSLETKELEEIAKEE
mgnify:CR=1 FL=1